MNYPPSMLTIYLGLVMLTVRKTLRNGGDLGMSPGVAGMGGKDRANFTINIA